MKNPEFKQHMITSKLLRACAKQVQKYFGEIKMDGHCEICSALTKHLDCVHCPLGDGKTSFPHDKRWSAPCVDDETFITEGERTKAKNEGLIARGNRLIEIFGENMIEIYEVPEK